MNFRIGFGFDSHRLAQGQPLIIGGIAVPSDKGTVAHSDGDVLIHALCDAILGALAVGDIGTHFPDNDDTYKGINSTKLLTQVMALCTERQYKIGNIDSTVILQEPKIAGYIDAMRKTIAAICKCDMTDVSIKATTAEKMDAVGRGDGMAAYATVLVKTE